MKKNTLLLVDDDEIFCQLLARAFTKRGMHTYVANDATTALQHAEQIKPDFAVVDLRMPDSSGLELIPLLLKIHPAMRITVLTGYASINNAVEAMSLDRLEWEHLQKVLGNCDGNVSAATRQLGMHRRMLTAKAEQASGKVSLIFYFES